MSYACNTARVSQECERLKRELGPDGCAKLYALTGAPLHNAYALAQLRGFYNDPDTAHLRQRLRRWQTLGSLCLARWTGEPFCPISLSEASWTGLLHVQTGTWDPTVLSLLGESCQASLPDLSQRDWWTEGLSPTKNDNTNPYWERWPELRGCRLFLAMGDGACANIGSKCTVPSRIAVTIGTSAAVRVVLPSQAQPPPQGLFLYRISPFHVLLGGALTDGGSVVEWARRLLGLTSDDAFLSCVEEVRRLVNQAYASYQDPARLSTTGSTEVMVPFLSGERSLGFRAGATMGMMGLTRDTTPSRFLKSCLEAVVLRLAKVLERLRQDDKGDDNATLPRLVVSGGALERNSVWRQMLADCTGLDVLHDFTVKEASSRGAALWMAKSLRNEPDDTNDSTLSVEDIGEAHLSTPNRTRGCILYWEQSMKRQEALINALEPLW